MLPGKTYKPEDLLNIIRKRFWAIVLPWAIIAAGTAGVARLLPDMYRSQAQIQYVPPRVPDTIMRGTSGSALTERLRATEQIVLSRTRLEQLIREFNLYQDELKTSIMEDVATKMRANITAAPLKGDIFRVQYVGRNPLTVMKVTERLAASFIEEGQKDSQRKAEGTSSFVEAAVDEKHRQLLEIEDKLTKYRMRHSTEMPSQMGANVQAVSSIQTQLQANSMAMTNDVNRLRDVERMIDDLESQSGPSAAPQVAADPSAMTGTAAQNYNTAKQKLNSLIARGVLPTHYDYINWERAMKQFEKEMNEQALRTPVSSTAGLPPAEVLRLKQLTTLRGERDNLKAHMAQLQAQEKQLREKATQYQSRVDQAPLRDAELIELQREYDTIKNIYEGLLAKREAANLSVDLQRRQIGEQFMLLDAASLPQKPSSPNRTVINIFGIAGGLAFGVLLVALLEYRDSSFKNDSELAGILALPVLAVVPLMLSDAERRAQFRRRLMLNLGLGSTVAVCLAVLAYSFLFVR